MTTAAGGLTVAGYRAGWSAVRRLPERAAYAMFDRIADATYLRNGSSVARLRANYAKVRPELGPQELERLVRAGLRSYMRYYCDAFRLPDQSPEDLLRSVRIIGDGPVRERLARGKGVVCFLGHMGNWDVAGAWGATHLGQVVTVAERLKPEEVYAEFLAFREGLGMRIYPLTGGGDVFALLRAELTGPVVLPLLADRDLTATGVEVDFCGHRARMAAGPAALGIVTGAPVHPVSIRYERAGRRWRSVITFHPPVPVPAAGRTAERVAAVTQACADVLGAAVREHTENWHMMQRVFVEDLDASRLAVDAGRGGGSRP